ncbi:MAG: peptide chain release factor N(5)-glutamine methyltransferase, partial [Spirochaetaceae bacterium]|nr:peptide chain release factor N(5)-glutamine methyltransferase [Spirochaetaceae bacterium]
MITIREALTEGTSLLKESQTALETPFLDAILLLSYILNVSKEKLLASYPDPISRLDYTSFMNMINKRSNNSPVAYLTKQKEFFGLKFYVDESVLVPRPDSETLVEKTLDIIAKSDSTKNVLDLCTGSGALAIALKHTKPKLNISCSDISEDAVKICIKNSRKILGKELNVIQSNLFDKIKGKFDLIITNPPYLTT